MLILSKCPSQLLLQVVNWTFCIQNVGFLLRKISRITTTNDENPIDVSLHISNPLSDVVLVLQLISLVLIIAPYAPQIVIAFVGKQRGFGP